MIQVHFDQGDSAAEDLVWVTMTPHEAEILRHATIPGREVGEAKEILTGFRHGIEVALTSHPIHAPS